MLYGPDISSGEDEDDYFGDDPDYELYKEKLKKSRQVDDSKEDNTLKTIFRNITSGNTEEVIRLLKNSDNGVDIDLENGWKPLLLASSLGQPQLVAELIKAGANITSTKDSLNALMLACESSTEFLDIKNLLEVLQILVENGINVDAIDRKRRTALMMATFNGNLETVQFLLPICDKNAVDNQKWTALFWAVYGNHPKVVKFLLSEGFSIEHRDVRDITPIELAKENGLEEVIKLFPTDEADEMLPLLEHFKTDFDSCFGKTDDLPLFLLDVSSILCGTKSQSLINIFVEHNVGLREFLALTDMELRDLGIQLPFQRSRIITGLYRLHKHNFNTNSIPFVEKNALYSNLDIAQAIVSAIKQLIVMECSLKFMLKNSDYFALDLDIDGLGKQTRQIRKNIKKIKAATDRLSVNTRMWDDQNKPPDLIKYSNCWRIRVPWITLVTCGFGIIGVLVSFKLVPAK